MAKITRLYLLPATVLLAVMLGGCGLTQKVTSGTIAVTKSIFYKEAKTVHLDFQARSALNTDSNQVALATVVRIYQLRHADKFFRSSYDDLMKQDNFVLGHDLLREDSVTLLPNGNVELNVPLNKEASYIGVVGLFRSPDVRTGGWRMLLKRSALLPDRARIVVVGTGSLMLEPMQH